MADYRLPLIWVGCLAIVIGIVVIAHVWLGGSPLVGVSLTAVLGIGSVPVARRIERSTRRPRFHP